MLYTEITMRITHPFSPSIRKKIIPAILAHSKKEFLHTLSLVKTHYPANRFQIDVLDGKFVPYTAWCDAKKISQLKLKHFDAHLMTRATHRQLRAWKAAGSDRIFIHYEAVAHPAVFLQEMRRLQIKVGIALNPETSPSVLRLLLPFLDAILLMGEHPGYGGQPFRKGILARIKKIRQLAPKLPIIIDGGVTAKSAPLLLEAGATELASGHTALSPFEKNL